MINETTVGPDGEAECRIELSRLIECWWLWKIENNTIYLNEGLRRMRGLIKPWDGTSGFLVNSGTTSYAVNDHAARNMLACAAIGFDLYYAQLTSGERIQCMAMAAPRLDSYTDDTVQIGLYPLRANYQLSHPLVHACVGGLAGLLFASHESEYSASNWATNIPLWARNADLQLQAYSTDIDESGLDSRVYGYSRFTWEFAPLVECLGPASGAGLDLFQQHRHRWRARAMSSVYPATAVKGFEGQLPFGDTDNAGSFDDYVLRTYGAVAAEAFWSQQIAQRGLNAVTSVVTLPLARGQWWMMRGAPAAASAASVAPAVLFAESGVAALHSSITDNGRVSVWFRSSEYGSYNHRHTDHNSFAIFDGGRPLFIKSGYYNEGTQDSFASNYWYDWYVRSLSSNTVACNNRLGHQTHFTYGQGVRARRTRGRIVRFLDASTHAYVVGDAKNAYQHAGYQHTKALRAIVMLRPNVILVFDAHDLTSGSYNWNWLFHTATQPNQSAGVVTISNIAVATLSSLYANRSLSSYTLTDTSWTTGTVAGTSPGSGADVKTQWHNSVNYASGSTLRSCHMIVCTSQAAGPTAATASAAGDVITANVTLAGQSWVVSFDAATNAVTVT